MLRTNSSPLKTDNEGKHYRKFPVAQLLLYVADRTRTWDVVSEPPVSIYSWAVHRSTSEAFSWFVHSRYPPRVTLIKSSTPLSTYVGCARRPLIFRWRFRTPFAIVQTKAALNFSLHKPGYRCYFQYNSVTSLPFLLVVLVSSIVRSKHCSPLTENLMTSISHYYRVRGVHSKFSM